MEGWPGKDGMRGPLIASPSTGKALADRTYCAKEEHPPLAKSQGPALHELPPPWSGQCARTKPLSLIHI